MRSEVQLPEQSYWRCLKRYFSNCRVSDYQTSQHGKKCSHFPQGERASFLHLSALSVQHWPLLLHHAIKEILRPPHAVTEEAARPHGRGCGTCSRPVPGLGAEGSHKTETTNTVLDSFYVTNIEKGPLRSQTGFAAIMEGNLFALS